MNNNDYHPSYWPKFNGKYPEDMTIAEIMEYVDKDDLKSIYLIIAYCRGYFNGDVIVLYNEILKKINKKDNFAYIIRIIDILLEMFPQYSKEYLAYAIKANVIEIVNHINKKHYEFYGKNI